MTALARSLARCRAVYGGTCSRILAMFPSMSSAQTNLQICKSESCGRAGAGAGPGARGFSPKQGLFVSVSEPGRRPLTVPFRPPEGGTEGGREQRVPDMLSHRPFASLARMWPDGGGVQWMNPSKGVRGGEMEVSILVS